jgi:hypothetical protein
MSRNTALAALALASVICAGRAGAVELPQEVDKKVTLELREADVRNVYRLFGDLTGLEMRVDACLQKRTVDVKLKNAPVSMVLDVIGAKLGAVYALTPDKRALLITCRGVAPTTVEALAPVPNASDVERSPAFDKRITLDVKDARLDRVCALLAQVAGVTVHPMGELRGTVTMSVHNVRVETAMAVLRESLDLEVLDIVDGELVVSSQPATDP